MLENQRAENQVKMHQIQGEVSRAKATARVYEDYTQMEHKTENETKEVEIGVYWKENQKR